jgi:glucosylceramidase
MQFSKFRARQAGMLALTTAILIACGGGGGGGEVSNTSAASNRIASDTSTTQETDLGFGLDSQSLLQKFGYTAQSALSSANVWLTTPDGSAKLTQTNSVAFSTLTSSNDPVITVDPTLKYQPVEGFGASITDSSAEVLYRLSEQNRENLMRSLFDRNTGNGLNILRQPIGGSDFVATAAYTYNDIPADQTDYQMQQFSIAHDEQKILPLLRQAKAINPSIKIIASPWSPPAWMKTNGSLVGGELKDSPEIYKAYALYFVKFIQAYTAAGVRVDAITLQNEPLNRTPLGYPGMHMSTYQQGELIKVLGPALKAANISTKILAYDHNWTVHPDDIAATPPGQPIETEYPAILLSNPQVAPWISGVAYHCYYGSPVRQRELLKAYPKLAMYITECSASKSLGDSAAKAFSDTLRFHARNLEVGGMRNGARTVVNWNIALDPDGNPHVGGCATCIGVVTIGPDQQVTQNAEYYLLGHLSRFVKRGALRIASTSFGTPEWNGQIMSVAFRNPDGSTVLVVHNENDAPKSFSVKLGSQGFSYTLPGGSVATFVWQGQADGENDYKLLDPLQMVATANPPAPTNPCCTVDVAAHMIDDDASTRWASGTGQEPGHYVQVDMGRSMELRRVVLDAGTSAGDYLRGYSVQLSSDGTNWSTPVATGNGAGQITAIDFPCQSARYVRVTSTASVGNWWSLADIRMYR